MPNAPINATLSKPENPPNDAPDSKGLPALGIKSTVRPLRRLLPVRSISSRVDTLLPFCDLKNEEENDSRDSSQIGFLLLSYPVTNA